MAKQPNWTKEEKEYLIENWGTKSVKAIAKTLGRSETAVVIKSQRYGLGTFLDSGDYVTLNQLMNALGINNGASYTVELWKRLGIPIMNKRVRNSTFKVIKIEKFWKWAEANKARLDFSKLPKNMLGEEPEWVEQKRKQDSIKRAKASKSVNNIQWTKYEDNYLLSLLQAYKYTTNEIAERLGRSEGAIIRRISELNIKYRPLRNSPHTPWNNDEYKLLQELIYSGGNYTSIRAEILQKKLYEDWYTEYGELNSLTRYAF